MNGRGFTLVELLVAMLLFALLGAAGFTAWTRGNSAWRAASLQQQLHERAQYVFAALEPELQMAGYFGATPPLALPADSIPLGAQVCGLALLQRLDLPVEVTPGYALPCAARGGGAMGDSQQLTLRRVSAQTVVASSGRAQWLAGPATGQLSWNEMPVAPAAPALERRDLLIRVYYVARAADGDAATPALRMKSLSSVAGQPAFVDTEVMPGVESMHILLLPDAAAPRSVRLTLTLRPDEADSRGRQVRRLTLTREFALRNAAG
jgi:prepilin-type N-terminal cleavage/methylation domain-containing protein